MEPATSTVPKVEVPAPVEDATTERLMELTKEELVEKILTLKKDVMRTRKVWQRSQKQENLAKLKLRKCENEMSLMEDERNHAYWSGIMDGPAQKDQLLDPYLYEAFVSMKEQLKRKTKECQSLYGTLKAIKSDYPIPSRQQHMNVLDTLKEVRSLQRRVGTLKGYLASAEKSVESYKNNRDDKRRELADKDSRISELEATVHELKVKLVHNEKQCTMGETSFSPSNVMDEKEEEEEGELDTSNADDHMDSGPLDISNCSEENENGSLDAKMGDEDEGDYCGAESEGMRAAVMQSMFSNNEKSNGGERTNTPPSGERQIAVDDTGSISITL